MTSATLTPPHLAARPRLRRRLLLGAAVVTIAAIAAAMPMAIAMLRPAPPPDVGTTKVTAHGRYRVRLAPESSPVPVGRLHRWTVRVDAAADAAAPASTIAPTMAPTVTIDGGMPQHGHGLPTQPRVTGRLPDGRLVIDGMKFSMPGWWELRLRVAGPAGTDSVAFNLVL